MERIGVRRLDVLKEFRPFGLQVEAFENGEKITSDKIKDESYSYSIVDSQVFFSSTEHESLYQLDSEYELFFRGNRLIWSSGSQVIKQLTTTSSIIKACWCRMEHTTEPLLCVLHVGSLTIYAPSGELASIAVPPSTMSIWPVPLGLLLQKGGDQTSMFTTESVSCSSAANKDFDCLISDVLTASSNCEWPTFESPSKSSHFLLRHTLEEPQALLFQDKCIPSTMHDPEEHILWTSYGVPYVASYNKGTKRHSVWYLNVINWNRGHTFSLPVQDSDVPQEDPFSCLSRIWQDKCMHTVANEVVMVSDYEGMHLICFVFKVNQCLISLRLDYDEKSQEGTSKEISVSFTLPAVTASAVTVTCRRSNIHGGYLSDLFVMAPDGNFYLYVGKHCLCKFVLPSDFLPGEIMTLSDAVHSRVNIVLSSGKVFRCSLRTSPFSAIMEDCIQALSEGLSPLFFQHFIRSLWSYDFNSLCNKDFNVDVEWETFSSLITSWINTLNAAHKQTDEVNMNSSCNQTNEVKMNSAWQFLLASKIHKDYSKICIFPALTMPPAAELALKPSRFGVNVAHDDAKDGTFVMQILSEILDILHTLYENYKLDILHKRNVERLVSLVSSIAACLGEVNYVDHYIRDFPGLLPSFATLHSKRGCRNPPNLLAWLQNCLKYGCSSKDKEGLPHLLCCNKNFFSVDWSRKVLAFYGLLLGCERNGDCLVSGIHFNVAHGTAYSPEHWTVLSMVAEGFGLQQLDRLPHGICLPLRHALEKCRESLPLDWPPSAYVLVGREDLALATKGIAIPLKSPNKVDSLLNHLNLLHMSSPYALHLQPLNVPLSTTDPHDTNVSGMERLESMQDAVVDGMEHIFNSNTQLRFGRDLRLCEVRRLLCSATPVAVTSASGPVDDDQQGQLWHITQRTAALPFGRGAFTVSSTTTMLTEAMIIPALDVSGRVTSMNNLIVQLNATSGTIADVVSWPEFHNGVAAGLKIARNQAKMTRTWIQYNKPEEPNFSHAGFLMALGLQGHLQVLTRTDIFEYLSQTHEATIIGTVLGVAASHRGTMHSVISKMLFMHIPSQHPSSFPELEFATDVQSAAILAVGLLYQDTMHPVQMRVLLDEIGRKSGGGNVLERERYAIAAGLAFGLVTLGRGNSMLGTLEPAVNKLFQYMSGAMEMRNESHALDHCLDPAGNNQVMDGLTLNIDVTAPAAIVALALTFLKTECESIASKISVPDTHYGLLFVRPDFVLLRVVARNLILWSRIIPSESWIESQIPNIIHEQVMNMSSKFDDDSENVDMQALVQSFVNIIAGSCLSIGLKFAGSENANAQELLHSYATYFLNEIKPVASSSYMKYPRGLLKYVDRATLETCLSVTILSLSLVMAGTGHLQTFRLLRYLHSRIDVNGHVKYGNHMAVSMAIGFLFLGGGTCSFATNNSAIAALFIALYPVFPTRSCDNNTHLQAFRHLYVLAIERRYVQAIDVDTGRDVYVPLEITISETCFNVETAYCRVTPCILPERSILKKVKICGPRYWPHEIEFCLSENPWWGPKDTDDPFKGGKIYVKRKVGICSYNDDPTGSQSLLSRAMHKMATDGGKDSYCTKDKSSRLSKIDQLVNAFSADPSLLAFAQLCCRNSWSYGDSSEFQEFCVQVLLQCVSTDCSALLQMYLYLYTAVASLAGCFFDQDMNWTDTLALSYLKVAKAYLDALVDGRLRNTSNELLQLSFVAALGKRVEDMLKHWQQKRRDEAGRYIDFVTYLSQGMVTKFEGCQNNQLPALFLACYLKWYSIPPADIVNCTMEKLIATFPKSFSSSNHNPRIPVLALMLPGTHISALKSIDECYSYAT